jgi:hypothetical protein
MSEESWKPVVGHEGYYEISDHGRLRSVYREQEVVDRSRIFKMRFNAKMMKFAIDRSGYLRVRLSKSGIKSMHSVHRLVMAAFAGQSPMDVNHKDGNKQNNRFSNLEYCTESENLLHRYRVLGQQGPRGSRNALAVLTEKDIPAIRADQRKLKEIADEYGVTAQAIWQVKKRRSWAHV